jgi:E3 ubiquitin-protein ligase RNF115/126
MQPGMLPGQNAGGPRRPGEPPLPFDLLQQMLTPGNVRSGDAVYSQEAFDRIMTQLMEQQNGSTAPPPASEEAIRSLGKKKVDRAMLGDDGKAECSICMDNVELGSEVTVLPCNHWFHGDCVTSWLKEHDTCPHCRKPISDSSEGRRTEPPPRRASAMRRYPDFNNPDELRHARQQYYDQPRSPQEAERPEPYRHSSSQSDTRRHSSRSHHSSGAGSRSGGNNGGGGVTGWIREHFPFS